MRREAKRRVFVVNALRALRQVAPRGDLRALDFVVLLGGSALDFEVPDMLADALAPYGVVCGTGNVHGTEGPRNAVASGLVMAYAQAAARRRRREGAARAARDRRPARRRPRPGAAGGLRRSRGGGRADARGAVGNAR